MRSSGFTEAVQQQNGHGSTPYWQHYSQGSDTRKTTWYHYTSMIKHICNQITAISKGSSRLIAATVAVCGLCSLQI